MEPGRDLKAGVLPKNNSRLIGNLVQFVCSGLIVASPSLAVARWNPFVCASTRPPAMEQGSSITKPCLWPALTKPTASWNPACTKLGCCLELGCYQGFLLFILIMFSGFDFSCFDCSLLDCFFFAWPFAAKVRDAEGWEGRIEVCSGEPADSSSREKAGQPMLFLQTFVVPNFYRLFCYPIASHCPLSWHLPCSTLVGQAWWRKWSKDCLEALAKTPAM